MSHDSGLWPVPPVGLVLPSDEVHVWRIPLDRAAEDRSRLRALLSPDECGRADRFHFAAHRDRFTVGRGMLRTILGRMTGRAPEKLAFRYGPRGKPELADVADPIEFNLAHSGGVGVLALARGRRVGVDIEQLRALPDGPGIIARYFSPRERAEFALVPEPLRVEAFYRGWTRKEAYMKAVGEGFSLPLGKFAVSLTPGAPARLVHVEGEPEEPGRWTYADLEPGPGFLGAVLVEGIDWRLRPFHAE